MGKQIFTHGSFPEVGQKQKTENKEREKERLNNGNNNGQLRIPNATSCGAKSRLGQQAWLILATLNISFEPFLWTKYDR